MAARGRSTRLRARLAGAVALAGLCAGCSAVTDPAGYSIVPQDKYDFMICRDIVGQRNGLVAREKLLSELIEKADASFGGTLVSAAAYRSEYVQVRTQARLANRAAQEKGCDAPKKP